MTQRFGLGNIACRPLEGGWLAGKYRADAENPEDSPRAKSWLGELADPEFRRRLEVVEALVSLSEGLDCSLAELCLAWVLRHPAVSAAIIGPRTMQQPVSCCRAVEFELDGPIADAIDELVPPVLACCEPTSDSLFCHRQTGRRRTIGRLTEL